MEQRLPLLPGGANAASASAAAPLYLALDSSTAGTSSPPSTSPPPAAAAATPSPASYSGHERGTDTIKTKIMSHRLYPALLRAFIECQKVGAPPEVVGRLSALAAELESRPDDVDGRRQEPSSDPELDEFMETYCEVLVRYRQELTRPIQEADEFFRTMEAQMESFAIDDNSCEGGGTSEEEEEAGDVAGGLPEITGQCAEDKELKNRLLNKYSGYLSSLWRELSKKKKKGKLPRDARQKLLHWWQLHYRWPYPSEVEKAALAESTGLDAKQINNWFINQRKRHWKPTPAAAADYRLQPPPPPGGAAYGGGVGASSSSSAALRKDGQYFPGGGAYPRGP